MWVRRTTLAFATRVHNIAFQKGHTRSGFRLRHAVLLGCCGAGLCANVGGVRLPARMESQSAGSTPLDRSSPENFVIVRTDSRSARASDLEEVVRAAGDHDVVLVGECHDDPTAHRLEILLLQRLFAKHGKTRNIMLSLEMFETDVQLTLDEYLRGEIRERDMLTDCRPWVNYSCRRPLVEFARANNIPVIAANAPRRYVSSVGRAGRDVLNLLPPTSLQYLPPLPYAQPSEAYRLKFEEQMRALHAPKPGESAVPGGAIDERSEYAHGQQTETSDAKKALQLQGKSSVEQSGNRVCPYIGWTSERTKHMLDAQVLWDATMAHSICRAFQQNDTHHEELKPPLVLHVCGKFHCEERRGIPEHMPPSRSTMVVCVVPTEELSMMHESQVAKLAQLGFSTTRGDSLGLLTGEWHRSWRWVTLLSFLLLSQRINSPSIADPSKHSGRQV